VPPQLHLAENTLPLHLLLERLERLIDIVVTHEDLHLAVCSFPKAPPPIGCADTPVAGDSESGDWRYNTAVDSYKPIFRHRRHDTLWPF
jgi:hypothetical protein